MHDYNTQSATDFKELLRRATHDLRAPLNQIRTFAALLAKQYGAELPEDARIIFDHLQQSARRAGIIVDGLDTFSHSMRTAEPEEIGLNAAMDAALADLAPEIRRDSDLIERTDLGPAWADRRMVIRVFTELLTNSLKFRGPRPLQVNVSAERHEGWVTVSVSDNGMGIDAADAETVFQPLTRLNGFRYEGAGMGLTLCRELVARQGGRMRIEPSADGGTAVRFTLPLT